MSSQCKNLIDAFFEFLISFSCSIVNGNARPRDSQFSLPPFKYRKASSVKVLHWYAECDLLIVKTEANVVTDELVETLISDRHDSAAIFCENFCGGWKISWLRKISVSSDSEASNEKRRISVFLLLSRGCESKIMKPPIQLIGGQCRRLVFTTIFRLAERREIILREGFLLPAIHLPSCHVSRAHPHCP